MNYLEVKYEMQIKDELNTNDFISNVISSQQSLGRQKYPKNFEHKKLLDLGFTYNKSTDGYGFIKNFSFEELKDLAFKIDKLDNHILTHGYIVLKIYKGELYFWDTALIYENIDTFEYCLKYHNIFKLGELNVLTKSTSVNEVLLNLSNYTKRYEEPELEFITQNCVWDKKEGVKTLKSLVENINEYIHFSKTINY